MAVRGATADGLLGRFAPLSRKGHVALNFFAHELTKHFHFAAVNAKEYMEYAPGLPHAVVKPAHCDALCFTLRLVTERKMGVQGCLGRGHKA